MFTLFVFIAVLAILVLSHEFGHFIVARKSGIKVDEFGFGFPPRLVGIRRLKKAGSKHKWQIIWGHKKTTAAAEMSEYTPGTLYSINLIPLGGFVKIKGEDGSDATDHDSFAAKKVWQKALVIVAGVLMNVVVAAVLLSVGFMVGLPQISEGAPAGSVRDQQLQIIQVLPGNPAEAAGFKIGDVIVSVGNLKEPEPDTFREYINTHRDEDITVTIKRGSEIITKKIHPIIYEDTGKGGLGVAIAEVGLVRYPWYRAIYYGILATGVYLKEILFAFALLIKGLFTGSGVEGGVSGPVGVAVMTGQVARMGVSYLLQFIALLSLNLAVLNILPIPALDGGRLLFIVIRAVTRRPVAVKYEQLIHTVGFILLMLLVIAVTVKDLGSFF